MAADYYGILGVHEHATAEDIRKAYHIRALKLHPDRNPTKRPESEELFKQVVEAYNVLSNPCRRRQYDLQRRLLQSSSADSSKLCSDIFSQFCASPEETSAFARVLDDFFATDLGYGQMGFDGFGDMETIFGSGSPAASKPPSDVLEVPLLLTLEELYVGCTKAVPVKWRLAEDSGCRPRAGVVMYNINVKPGWKEGTRVSFTGSGRRTQQAVCFLVKQQPHSRFQRQGDNLHTRVQVPLLTALAGGSVQVTTLDGRELEVAVPGVPPAEPCAAGSGRREQGLGAAQRCGGTRSVQSENSLRDTGGMSLRGLVWDAGMEVVVVRGEGMPVSKRPGARGDLHVEMVVGMPAVLSEQQKQMLRQVLG